MIRIICILLIISPVFAQTQIPPGYYDATYQLSGEPLRSILFDIIKNHTIQNYSNLWTHFQTTDNNSGLVWDMYSDIPSGSPSYTYNFGSDQCGNYSSEGDCYNREHSVPQSWFNGASPMYSDLFHLYPTDGYVNGQRSNYPFGEVGSASFTSTNGSRVGSNTYPGYSGTVFEPIDDYKGDFARTYFYMMTRYKNNVASWASAMFTGDNLATWSKNMLLSWSNLDPVDQKEIDRNNAVYAIQGNRNPFIDQPDYIDMIWGPFASVGSVTSPKLSIFNQEGALKVENNTNSLATLEIVNTVGSRVFISEVETGFSTIQLNLVTGLYIARISADDELSSLKFMINSH